MYEYFPKDPKKKELWILLGLLGTGFFLYGISQIPGLPVPAVLQLLSVILMGGVVIVLTRYLLRDFCYRIEARDGFDVPDLTVTEYCGRRITVVCRISLNDIIEVRAMTAKEARTLAKAQKGRLVYDYTCRMDPDNLYLLSVRDGEKSYDIRIVADAGLSAYLFHR